MLMFYRGVFSLDGTRGICAISLEMKCLGRKRMRLKESQLQHPFSLTFFLCIRFFGVFFFPQRMSFIDILESNL